MTDENIDFSKVEDQEEEEKELTVDDFSGGNYLKNPEVGGELNFVVEKIVQNKNTSFVNKSTGKPFEVGLKSSKTDEVKRYDIHTDIGVYTIANWEIFFKLLGSKGLLTEYAKKHDNKFKGAKVKIKRLIDGGYANYKVEDIAKISNITLEEAKKYQTDVKQAIKEQRLYEVSVQ